MSSVYQTVDVLYNFSPLIFQTMGFCPKLPECLRDSEVPIRIVKENHTHVTWYPDGKVVEIQRDGTMKTWLPKPTLEKAVTMQAGGIYTEFSDKNNIVVKFGDRCYCWTSNPTAISTEGRVQKGKKDPFGEWVFSDWNDKYVWKLLNIQGMSL